MSSEGQVTGNTNLQKQDLATLDITKLTPLSPEVISRQATINVGTIGHVAHGKSTVVKAISGVHTVRFKNELERNITIKLERIPLDTLVATTRSAQSFRKFLDNLKPIHNPYRSPVKCNKENVKRKLSPDTPAKQTSILDFFGGRPAKKAKIFHSTPLRAPNQQLHATEISQPIVLVARLNTSAQTVAAQPQSDDCVSSTASSVITNLSYLNQLVTKNNLRRTSVPTVAQQNAKPQATEDEYTVERILKINEIEGKPHFFVKWKGYNHEANTWEPLENVRDCEPYKRFIESKNISFEADINKLANEMKDSLEDKQLSDEEAFSLVLKFDEMQLQSELLLLVMLLKNNEANTDVFSKIYDATKEKLNLLPYHTRRIKQLENLHEFEVLINSKDKSSNLTVENMVDFGMAPDNFNYINDVFAGEGVVIPDDPPVGCECPDGCKHISQCCGKNSGSKFAYNSKKRIKVPPGTPVFECNKRCLCGPECHNRVVQQGRKHSLCIYKTSNGCGWGVRTLRTIYEGQFICEYVGEILTYEETERRGRIYDAEGRTYLFDLDMNSQDNPYTIDAAHHGNVSHFINHSCDPNCGVWAVWINCLDLDLPRVCLFATRRIEAGEALSFDYMNHKAKADEIVESPMETDTDQPGSLKEDEQSIDTPRNGTQCRCQAANCRKFVF